MPELARRTPGYVGADLNALAKEAAAIAVNRIFKTFVASGEGDDFEAAAGSRRPGGEGGGGGGGGGAAGGGVNGGQSVEGGGAGVERGKGEGEGEAEESEGNGCGASNGRGGVLRGEVGRAVTDAGGGLRREPLTQQVCFSTSKLDILVPES
jgi:SpoVK/Ycf46/Vps4 family AAA+-type ATPase